MGYNTRAIKDVEIATRELSLKENSRVVGVSIAKDDDDRGSDKELDWSSASQYRGVVARMNYLGQEISQFQFVVKELGRGIAKPIEKDRGRLKKLVRFLKGCGRYMSHCCYQEAVNKVVVWTDTDFAGCKKGGKKTHQEV